MVEEKVILQVLAEQQEYVQSYEPQKWKILVFKTIVTMPLLQRTLGGAWKMSFTLNFCADAQTLFWIFIITRRVLVLRKSTSLYAIKTRLWNSFR